MSSESAGKQFVVWFVGSFVVLSAILFGVRAMRDGGDAADELVPSDSGAATAQQDFTRPPGAPPDWEPPAMRAGTDLGVGSLGAENPNVLAPAPPTDAPLPPPPMPGMAAEPPGALPFDSLPEAQRADAVLEALEDLPDWFAAQDPALAAAHLGTDCSHPPCLTGMAYDPDAFESPEAIGAFQRAFLNEVRKRLGAEPAASVVSGGPSGAALFTYVLPEGANDEERAALEASVAHRHKSWVASGGGPVGEEPDEDEE